MTCNRSVKKVQPIKCHVGSCPYIEEGIKKNKGSMFCVSCTNVFKCGEANNGICNTTHCYMVHYITENIKTVTKDGSDNEEEVDVDDL